VGPGWWDPPWDGKIPPWDQMVQNFSVRNKSHYLVG
jgi:hypothetical protein